MTQPPMSLSCPKCGADMRAYERNGVTVDQCTGCRGIFLDRGELERLIEAEGSYYAGQAGQVPPPMPGPAGQSHHGGYRPEYGGYGEHGKGRRRRGGFLGELFD